MRRLLGLLAAAALLLPAAAQAADSPRMAEFRRLCVATNADLDQVLALADKAGWSKGEVGQVDGDVTRKGMRLINDAEGERLLIAGIGDAPGGFNGAFCVLGVKGVAPAALTAEVAGVAAVPASKRFSTDGAQMFIYTGDGAARRSLGELTDAEIEAAVAKAPVHMIGVVGDESMIMILYAVLSVK